MLAVHGRIHAHPDIRDSVYASGYFDLAGRKKDKETKKETTERKEKEEKKT